MARRRQERPVPFSEVVQGVPEPSEQSGVWPQPVRGGVWTDHDGTVWRLRHNAGLRWIARLVASPDVRVLLAYGPDDPTEVLPADRASLWASALPHLEDRVTGSCLSYAVAESRDEQRRVLVTVEESC